MEVRKRYTSLTRRDEVVLIVAVRERGGGRQMFVMPMLDYAEGYGVTYGLASAWSMCWVSAAG